MFCWFGRRWALLEETDEGRVSSGPRGVFEVLGFGTDLPEVSSARFQKLIEANAGVFSVSGEPNGECGVTTMSITTTGRPISQKAYRTPLHKRRLVEDCVQEMLADGVIRPSCSPWASPITLVPKASGETRFCVDYRRINAVTLRDQYPLPLIDDIFDHVAGCAVYSTLDLRAGYHQIKMTEEDIPKTAFRCHLGLFEYTRMPFGLANAPAVFQRTMDTVLAGLLGKCVFVYLDDLCVYSSSLDLHERHLQAVFDRLEEAGLRLKPSKCHFALPEVRLLGHIISRAGKRPDPEKTAAIATLPPPTTLREVRSSLGSTSYYRVCIPDYALIAEPLTAMTRKHARMGWDSEKQVAFDLLKEELMSDRVMAPPRTDHPYKLHTDASDYCVGAILV